MAWQCPCFREGRCLGSKQCERDPGQLQVWKEKKGRSQQADQEGAGRRPSPWGRKKEKHLRAQWRSGFFQEVGLAGAKVLRQGG